MTMRTMWMAAAAAGMLAAPAAADTRAGVEAYRRGDYVRAVAEWRRAADAGDTDAQFNLGQAYKLGRGVPRDTAQAERWYARAAVAGHLEAADNYGLALFQNGRPRDALPWLEKSAARGEPRAQYLLGTMLFNGIDAPRDWVRAYALTSRAAASGMPQAQSSLTQMDGYLSADEQQRGQAAARALAAAPVAVAAPGTDGVAASPVRVAAADPAPAAPPPRRPAPRARPAIPTTPTTPAVLPRSDGGGWRLQLGAFGDAGNARRLGAQLAGRFPGKRVDYQRAGAVTRVLVGGYASAAAARAACAGVQPCVPVAP